MDSESTKTDSSNTTDPLADHAVELTTLTAAVDSLEVASEMLSASVTDVQRLAWAVVAVHQATQGLMVATLAGSDGSGALTRKGKKGEEVKEYLKRLWGREIPTPEPPERALASFPELYKSLKNNKDGSYMRRYVDSKAYVPQVTDDAFLSRLHELRNGFIHYVPKSWWIGAAYALEAIGAALNVLRFIVRVTPLVVWHPDTTKTRAEDALSSCETSFAALALIHRL